MTDALVPVLVETPVAVIVELCAVFSVMSKLLVPPTRAALEGRVASGSLDVIATVSVIVLIRLYRESTAFTVKLNCVPAVRSVGVPVLPVAEPGSAVSPGNSTCS